MEKLEHGLNLMSFEKKIIMKKCVLIIQFDALLYSSLFSAV